MSIAQLYLFQAALTIYAQSSLNVAFAPHS